MSEDEAIPYIPFRISGPYYGESLLSTPNLDATLEWHEATRARVEWEWDESTLDFDHPERAEGFEHLVWPDEYQYLSMGILRAAMIGREIRKALSRLGYEGPPREPAVKVDPQAPEDYESDDLYVVDSTQTEQLDADFLQGFPEPGDRALLVTAIDLANVLASLEHQWNCSEVHTYAVNNMDQVTIDEYEQNIPIIPRLERLPNWNVSGEPWEEDFNHYVSPPILIDCCEGVLLDLVDLILSGGGSRA